jgi:peptidoglycan/LPS O-acetylase OafA/YrhL
VVAILAFSMSFLAFTNRLLRYLNEAAYPIYVIHMPIVTVIGVYVVRLDINLYAKFVIIIALALTLALVAFEYLIRRIRVLRVLFGLKPSGPIGTPYHTTTSTGALTQG